MTTLIKYPFDPTGVRPTNLILDEQHDKLDPFTRLLIPKLGMYYTESLIVKDSTRIYALNTDYVPVEFDQETSLRVGKELCRAIIIKSTNYSLPITITYQVVGDDTTNNRNEVLIRFQELVDYTSNQSFNNLIEVPSALRSSPHPHGFNEIYGMEYIVNELDRITKAINDTPVPTINSILQHIDRYIELFNNLSQSNLDHFFISRIDEFLLTINRQFLQIENISNYTPGTLEDGLKVGDITTIKETVGTFEFPEKYATIETLIGLRQKIYKNCVTMRSCNIGYESAVYSEPRKNSLYVLNNQQTVTKVSQQTAIEENFPFDTGIYPDPVPIENEITITKISNDVTTNLGLLSSVDSTQEKMYLGRLSFNSNAFDTEWKTFDCTDKIHKLINVVVAHNNDFCEPYGDPHELVKSDIELDKVENLEVVSREDIIALTSTRKYLTFDSLIYFMRSFLLQNGKKSPIDDKSNNKFLIDNCQLVFSPAGVKCEVVCEERPLDFLKTDQLCILVETPPTTPTTTTTPSTTPTPSPTASTNLGSRIVGVVYNNNNNEWIIFSKEGYVNTSTDLVTFNTNVTLKNKITYLAANDPISTNFPISEITYNAITLIDGIYFVSGNNGWLFTSTDLTNWNAVNIYAKYNQTTGVNLISVVVKIGSLYVAALRYGGSTTGFISTTDGITWNTYSNYISERVLDSQSNLIKMTEINGHYYANIVGLTSTNMWHSPDNTSWLYCNPFVGYAIKLIAGNSNRVLVVLANNYQTAHSDDNGDTWTLTYGLQSMNWTGQNNTGPTRIQNLLYTGNEFVAVGVIFCKVVCATSTDGITWTNVDVPDQSNITDCSYNNWEGTNVIYGDNKLVMFAGKDKLGVCSLNGVSTTPSTTSTPSTSVTTPEATVLGDGVVVQGIITSLDDVKYYKVINTGGQPFDLTFTSDGGTPLQAVKWHCIANGVTFVTVNDWEFDLGWFTVQVAHNGNLLPGDVTIVVSGRDSIGGFTIKMDRFH